DAKLNRLWIDGAEQTLTQRVGVTNQDRTATSAARIGGWANDNGQRFSGRLDEVAFFSGLLTQANITAQYSARAGGNYATVIGGQAPIAYYRLGESSGAVA